jgi:acyl-CoA thioesterase FadM
MRSYSLNLPDRRLHYRQYSARVGSLAAHHDRAETFDVYIELTDAFGMLYNSNIPLLMERALAKTLNKHGRVINAKTIKFRKPARLGDSLELSIKPSKKDDVFTVKVSSIISWGSTDRDEIASATGVRLGCLPYCAEGINLSAIDDKKLFSSKFRVWDDELGPGNMLTTKTIFNLFERCRTDALGGPRELAASAADTVHFYGKPGLVLNHIS